MSILRERVGPGVCIFCTARLEHRGTRERVICDSRECKAAYIRAYTTGGSGWLDSEELVALKVEVRLMVQRCEEAVGASRLLRARIAAEWAQEAARPS